MALTGHRYAERIVRQMKSAATLEELNEIYESIEPGVLSVAESRWVQLEWTRRIQTLADERSDELDNRQ